MLQRKRAVVVTVDVRTWVTGSQCAGPTRHLWPHDFQITFEGGEQIAGKGFGSFLLGARGGRTEVLWRHWATPACFLVRWKWRWRLHRQFTIQHYNIKVNTFFPLTDRIYSPERAVKGKVESGGLWRALTPTPRDQKDSSKNYWEHFDKLHRPL